MKRKKGYSLVSRFLKCLPSGYVSLKTIFIAGIYEGVLPFVTLSVFFPWSLSRTVLWPGRRGRWSDMAT